MKKLEDYLIYEQPTKYIVDYDNYSNDNEIPVLTAGKSFILGYTNEKNNVFPSEKLPVIIFDDFTTECKYVEIPFKVKSSAMKILHPTKNSNAKYLYYFMKNIKFDNTLHKRYWISEYSKIPIKDISKKEQDEFSNKMSKIEKIINIKQNQIQNCSKLVKSQFVEMFGNPILNNKNNEVVKIEDIALKEKNAIKAGPFGSNLKKECYVSSGYKIYGQEQVIANDIKFGDYYIDEQKYNELISYAIKEDDILISLVGTYGKILIIPKLYEKGIINPRLMKISPNPKIINPYFFKILFDLMASVAKNYTHGGTMGILNVGIVKKMNIILPPIEEQKKYINIVNQIDKQKFELEKCLKKLEELQKSLMQEYFG